MSEPRSRVQIKELEATRLTRPSVIVGIPEVGLVGNITAAYLLDQLGLSEVAYVESDLMPQVIVVHDSEPKQPIRIFGKGMLAVVLSEIPLSPRLSYEFAGELVRWSKGKDSKMVIGVTGIPSKRRIESAEEAKPEVLAVTNDSSIRNSIKTMGIKLYEEGVIVGTYAGLLKHCVSHNMPNLTLLAESYLEFPDPGAAAAMIEFLTRLLPISVDIKPLLEESEEIRLRNRELMNKTQQAMQQMAPSVYR